MLHGDTENPRKSTDCPTRKPLPRSPSRWARSPLAIDDERQSPGLGGDPADAVRDGNGVDLMRIALHDDVVDRDAGELGSRDDIIGVVAAGIAAIGEDQQRAPIARPGRVGQYRYTLHDALVDAAPAEIVELIGHPQGGEAFLEHLMITREVIDHMEAAREGGQKDVVVRVEVVHHVSDRVANEGQLGMAAAEICLKTHALRDIDQHTQRGGSRAIGTKERDRTFFAVNAERKITRAERWHALASVIEHGDGIRIIDAGSICGAAGTFSIGCGANLKHLRGLERAGIEILLGSRIDFGYQEQRDQREGKLANPNRRRFDGYIEVLLNRPHRRCGGWAEAIERTFSARYESGTLRSKVRSSHF